MDRRRAKKDLRKFLALVKTLNVPCIEVIVFGSYARGFATERSDLDLCVVFDSKVKKLDPHMIKLSYAAGKNDLNVDLYGVTQKRLKTNKLSSIINEIRLYGIKADAFLA